MAVSDVKEYAHLTQAQVEQLGREFDAIRKEIEDSLGEDDAAYIRKMITLQRRLAVAARVTLFASAFPPAWLAGTAMLGVAKILENIEIGHNVMHGQWDWMNDPEIHSTTWEWDTIQPADQWRHSHNYIHHTFTNVLGRDNDVGYGILRVTRDQQWRPAHIGNPVWNLLLATLFQWGVGLHDLDIEAIRTGRKDMGELRRQLKQLGRKVRKQAGKDYLLFPLLTGPFFMTTLTANMTANLMRNLWAYLVIFVDHFPDGVTYFTEEELENETQGEWYLRQILGSANFRARKLTHVMAGYLSYQVEHHLYPDLPSRRYPQIARKTKALCEEYKIPYILGGLPGHYWQTFRTICKMSAPNGKLWNKDIPPVDPERSQRHVREMANAA
ncbi:MAG TPA: acyl-CoA desaturase [Frankiaceae bacterium]|jgi:linoleoyl-CoA desaturase|nr:acyl-CoA desaturase [Frankiaceae bacterium]